jgi:hypothetical protein
MQYLAIIALCIGAAIVYGIAHDQVTARVCVEYFTIGHPPVFGTNDPTMLGLGWGILATWWVGLGLGFLLARAARAGNRPPRAVGSLVRPVVQLMLVTGVSALSTGIIGWVAASGGWVRLMEPMASEVPAAKHTPFLADLWAHSASYLVGVVGGVVVCVRVWRSRNRMVVS